MVLVSDCKSPNCDTHIKSVGSEEFLRTAAKAELTPEFEILLTHSSSCV